MKNSKNKNQQGIVSIIVTMILMIVITLIVLAFAKLSRQEERNVLDRQLSTQAFYAAESGINYAKDQIRANPLLVGDYMDTCHQFTDAIASAHPAPLPPPRLGQTIGSGSGNSAFTCLFVKSAQQELKYQKTDAQIVFPFKPTDHSSGLTIYWDDGSAPGVGSFGGCPSPGTNPVSTPANCNASVLRVEITSDLASSKVFFIYPKDTEILPGPSFLAHTSGSRYQVICSATDTPQKCSVSIPDVPDGSYVRVKGIYGAIAVTAVANNHSTLGGAQALIDATGKAADVERRIQVRVSISGLLKDPPPYGLEGTDKICKQFYLDGTNAVGCPN